MKTASLCERSPGRRDRPSSVDRSAEECRRFESGAAGVAFRRGLGDGDGVLGATEGDDAPAEAGTGETSPEGTGRDQLLDENIELRGRDLEVVP
jgi:hypothetical protein